MKRVHLIFGLAVVIVFLLTGQYMDKHFHHLVGMPDAPRLLYRTRHIFILFSGLVNLGIGAYFSYRTETRQRVIQLLGSLFIFTASFLFVIGFFYEPTRGDLRTPLSHYGAYAIAAGVVLHVISGAKMRG
jgi:hypothetical protein